MPGSATCRAEGLDHRALQEQRNQTGPARAEEGQGTWQLYSDCYQKEFCVALGQPRPVKTVGLLKGKALTEAGARCKQDQ